jgi:hypothetical protein
MSNSLVSFTRGALASRIVVGYRGTESSPSLTPFEDAVDAAAGDLVRRSREDPKAEAAHASLLGTKALFRLHA